MPGIENPLIFDFPDSFDTPRLTISGPRHGDAPGLNAAATASFDALRLWMPWTVNGPQSLEETEGVIRHWVANYTLRKDNLSMVIRLRGSEEIIGTIGVHHIDWDVPKFEMGYWLRTDLEGKGLMTEAVNGLTAFLFEHLHAERVEIRCDVLNHRSAAVALRAGYTLEGTFRRDSRGTDGQLRDTMIFARVREG